MDSIAKINIDAEDSAGFIFSKGREVENYFPNEAIRYAVEKLGNYDADELKRANLSDLKLEKFDRYFETVENHLVSNGVSTVDKFGKPRAKNYTNWGLGKKVQFNRTALSLPGLTSKMMRYDFVETVESIVRWINARRVN